MSKCKMFKTFVDRNNNFWTSNSPPGLTNQRRNVINVHFGFFKVHFFDENLDLTWGFHL